MKIYSFLSGQQGSFDAKVIGTTSGKVPFVLDGIVGTAAQFNLLVHYVDNGGVSDHIFALHETCDMPDALQRGAPPRPGGASPFAAVRRSIC